MPVKQSHFVILVSIIACFVCHKTTCHSLSNHLYSHKASEHLLSSIHVFSSPRSRLSPHFLAIQRHFFTLPFTLCPFSPYIDSSLPCPPLPLSPSISTLPSFLSPPLPSSLPTPRYPLTAPSSLLLFVPSERGSPSPSATARSPTCCSS